MHAFVDDLVFDSQLVRRFDIHGPRYTSYPTADRFGEQFTAAHSKYWLARRSSLNAGRPLSLYVHIPFCSAICYYCACNKIVTKDHGRSAKYLRYLAKEFDLQCRELTSQDNIVGQLHWGGGTPTFLAHDEMRQLMAMIRRHFRLLEQGEYSIEVDPRQVDHATVELLGELGFNRMSVGVQDFDANVQRAINRVQSEAETFSVIEAARASGFVSIGIDLIYGLPRQNVKGFEKTLERVIAADPDRLSVYNYAHLPRIFRPQRRISESDMPTADERLQILSLAVNKLTEAGYVFIGMDHFAKPGDELAIAQREHRLHRNFQGYSTFADCDMLSFGISSISKVGSCYAQNLKTLDTYYASLDAGVLPVWRGVELDDDDLLRRSIIQSLMCHFHVSFAAVEQAHGIDFETYFAREMETLRAMDEAGLLRCEERSINVLPHGRLLVRGIAMAFDKYLQRGREAERYSKVI